MTAPGSLNWRDRRHWGGGPMKCVMPDGTVHLGDGPLTGAAWVRRAGKKAAGRMLDGHTHDAFPAEPAPLGGTP